MHYTDRYGKPLAVGDHVVICVHAARSSATMKDVTVVNLVPLVPHRDRTEPRRQYQRSAPGGGPPSGRHGPIEGYYYMREDQQHQARPTVFYRPKDTAADKLFVLQYEYEWTYWRGEKIVKKQSFDRVMDVIKVPDA